MFVAANNPDNQRAIELTKQARTAELEGNLQDAYGLYGQASALLVKAIANCEKKTEERRRAKLCLRATTDRQKALRACIEGEGSSPEPLPSLATLSKEMETLPETIPLSLVEMGQLANLPQEKLEAGQIGAFLTPLLPPSLLDVTYHVYLEVFRRWPHVWIYYHIKDSVKSCTLYTLSGYKPYQKQISVSTLARAAEYDSNCVRIIVAPITPRSPRSLGKSIGRPFTITTGAGTTVTSTPDRIEKKTWTPRRFIYGGRKFVWKEDKGRGGADALYEVKREWADPESKTGKVMDETFERPLVWLENKISAKSVCTIHMVGGLDLLFREFLLAELLTRRLISAHGH